MPGRRKAGENIQRDGFGLSASFDGADPPYYTKAPIISGFGKSQESVSLKVKAGLVCTAFIEDFAAGPD